MDVKEPTARKRKPRQISPASRLLPAKVAERDTGVSYGALRDAVFRGDLAVVKIGKAWYFERSELNRWIERSTETAPR